MDNAFMAKDITENTAITMYGDDGKETNYLVLSAQACEGGGMFLLVQEILSENLGSGDPESEDPEELSEAVYLFKCVATEEDDMVFEPMNGDHKEYEKAAALFRDDFETLGIDCES